MRPPTLASLLPAATAPTLVGRVWDVETGGPRVVAIGTTRAFDLTETVHTVSGLLERADAAELVAAVVAEEQDVSRADAQTARHADVRPSNGRRRSWSLTDLVEAAFEQDSSRSRLLSPIDLQVIKACGVTFVDSMIERVIEERAAGDPELAAAARARVLAILGGSLSSVRPGSAEAAKVKDALLADGMWSQYLEVGIGADPEVFTKGPVLSSVGVGAAVGIPAFSHWNNPEPELVLLVNSAGSVRGATLGNDVNLRDVEGRSALLLGMAKDNNASTAVGPFIRLFDDEFTIDDLRDEELALHVVGDDGFTMTGTNSLSRISRPFEALVSAAFGTHHQYPDGFALFTGTLFAPTQDRGTAGHGFTHHLGDVVTIASERLGTLTNIVGRTEELPRWEFGIRSLMEYVSRGRA